jgi:catechol 2,3-dioxygenase-like lactoylglutathione lyase family enzyme
VLTARDPDATQAFYCDVLGLIASDRDRMERDKARAFFAFRLNAPRSATILFEFDPNIRSKCPPAISRP